MWRIAVLHHGFASSPLLGRLRKGLLRRGLVEGRDHTLDAVGAEACWDRLPGLAEQLLRGRPDLVVAIGAKAALAAQRTTRRVPIVYAVVLDPEDIGLGAPNVSGFTTFEADRACRDLRLLQQLVPGLRRVGFLDDQDAPRGIDDRNPLVARFLQAAATLRLEPVGICLSGIAADGAGAFERSGNAGLQALVALELPAVLARLDLVGRLAERRRLPLLSPYLPPHAGVVMQGTALLDAIDPLAAYVATRCRGARIAEIPIRTVRQTRLTIHLGRARRIGLQIPAGVRERATECIDDSPAPAQTDPGRIQPKQPSPATPLPTSMAPLP